VAVHFFLAVRRETVSAAVRNVLRGRWPAIAALAVVFLGFQSVSLSLHPIYRQQGWLQHHAFWHSVYYSLMYHPKYLERFNEMHERAEGDAMPMQAAVAYLRAHPDEDSPKYYYPGTKSLTYAAMEKFVRRAFFDFTRRYPSFVFETFFVVKPGYIWSAVRDEAAAIWQTAPLTYRLLFLSGVIALGIAAAGSTASVARLGLLTTIMSLAGLTSLGCPFLRVPSPFTMAEFFRALQCAAICGLARAAAPVARLCRGSSVAVEPAPKTRSPRTDSGPPYPCPTRRGRPC